MIIDWEHHYLPEELWVKKGGKKGERTILYEHGRPRTTMNPDLYDIEKHIEVMDETGIDVAVLSMAGTPDDMETALEECKIWDDNVSELMKMYPKRFVGIAPVHPLGGERALTELDRAISVLGFKGVIIRSQSCGLPLDSQELWPFYEKLSDLKVPLFIHTTGAPLGLDILSAPYDLGRSIGRELDLIVAIARIIFSGVMENFPDLKFVISHMGGGISAINDYFQNKPELINTTPFGQNVKAMMAIRLDKDTGNFFSRLKSDDYYLQKAKDGRLFDLFDVSPVVKRKRGGRYPTNVNITPNQFNRAFVQSQLTNFFDKGVNEETANQLDTILKERNIRVELPNVGRVGAAADVAYDSATGTFPRIVKTLESMEAPDEIKNLFKNTNLREQFENNTDNVCSIFGKASGGTVKSCVAQFDEAVQKNPESLFQKVLNFAKSPGVKRFTLAGAAGAAGAAIVKEFRNDDPTSYLSNEDQQKSMLVAMATDPIMDPLANQFDRPDILDYQLPALGAAAAASTALGAPSTIKASRTRGMGMEKKGLAKTGLRVLGRGLGIMSTPGALAPFAAADIASQVYEGDSATDIATNPFNYLYGTFADQTDKMTRGLKPTLRKVARLGMSPGALRVMSRAGLVGLAGSLGIQGYNLLTDD